MTWRIISRLDQAIWYLLKQGYQPHELLYMSNDSIITEANNEYLKAEELTSA